MGVMSSSVTQAGPVLLMFRRLPWFQFSCPVSRAMEALGGGPVWRSRGRTMLLMPDGRIFLAHWRREVGVSENWNLFVRFPTGDLSVGALWQYQRRFSR